MSEQKIEKIMRKVMVYDEEKHTWERGYRRNVSMLRKPTHLKWDNTGVATDVKPTNDLEINVEKADRIAVQADTTHPDNTSSSIDINVYALLDGEKWDNVPYAEMNLGDGEIKTMLVSAGIKKIRLRVDNNTAATTGYVRAIVKVRG